MSVPQVDVRVLSSWKEIASYLGVGVRTAQVWERERGLPVHRLPGPRGRVHATPGELDAWKHQRPTDDVSFTGLTAAPVPPGRSSWLRWAMAGLVLLSALGLFALAVRRPVLASVSVAPDALVGLDQSGGVLWRHAFGVLNEPAYATGARRSWVGDLDGRVSVLFVPIPAGIVGESVPLVCLDSQGRERWRFIPGKTVKHKGDVFPPPFVVRQFAIIGRTIIVTSHHHLYYPSQVAVLDHQGRLLREYWHPGHLNVLATGNYEGRPVAFLGGVNNAHLRATVVVLDPERLGGSAFERGQPVFDEMTMPVEAARLIFPRSRLSPTDQYNVVVHLLAQPDGLLVDVHERLSGSDPPSIRYHLDNHLALKQVGVSDQFLSEYRQQTKREFTTADEAALHQVTRVR